MKTVTKEQLEKLPHKFQVAFALFCTKQVSHLSDDKRVHDCIEVVEKWLEGKATADAIYDAYAYTATDAAARAASVAYTATDAAGAAGAAAYVAAAARAAADAIYDAIYDANREKIIEEQNRYYEELLNFDNIVEAELFKTETDL